MKHGVLIDRAIVAEVYSTLVAQKTPLTERVIKMFEDAISSAPDAVIPIAKAHVCGECPALSGGHDAWEPYRCGITGEMIGASLLHLCGEECPQITKE